MNAWPFITAAYAITILASGGIAFLSWSAMRRAEDRAGSIGKR
jgi:hypothetical protein